MKVRVGVGVGFKTESKESLAFAYHFIAGDSIDRARRGDALVEFNNAARACFWCGRGFG